MTPSSIDHRADMLAYRRHHAVNHSTLKHIQRSPAHYRHAVTEPFKATDATKFGSLVDHLTLGTPYRWVQSEYEEFKSKESREWKDDYESRGYDVFKEKVVAKARNCVRSILSRKAVDELLCEGDAQVAVYATLEGVECKGLIDWVSGKFAVLADLKTTCKDAAETVMVSTSDSDGLSVGDSWAREVLRRDYHTQAAFYADLFKAATGETMAFRWIVAESDPPHEVAVWEATEAWLELGRQTYRTRLATWRECTASGKWSGYPDKVQYLDVPKWMQK